jgi:hypothetical protein
MNTQMYNVAVRNCGFDINDLKVMLMMMMMMMMMMMKMIMMMMVNDDDDNDDNDDDTSEKYILNPKLIRFMIWRSWKRRRPFMQTR